MKMSEILVFVQKTSATHHKYVKELEDVLKEVGVDSFFDDFKKKLIIAFSKDMKLKNPFVERYYDFCIHFLVYIESKYKNGEESTFVTKIFTTVLECLEVMSSDIKYHACTFMHKYILYLIKKDRTINEDLYQYFTEAILDTLDDSNPQIRIISVNILKLLQTSDDHFSSILIDHLDDTNGKVRAAIVDGLIPDVNNLSHIINRCRDVDEQVRLAVFKKIADIPVQMLMIEQRQFLLKSGLKDRSERVKKCLDTAVVPSWLKYYEHDYMKFLKALQLDSNYKEIVDTKTVSELVLTSLFSSRPIQEILEALVLEDKLIPLDQLTWESTFLWRKLIVYLKSKNVEQYRELILPETVLFCNYVDKFCSTTKLLVGSIWEQQLFSLIFHELLSIVLDCDITDEASRQVVYCLLVTALKEKKMSAGIIDDVVKYFKKLIPNVERRVVFFCEMISDIRRPLVSKISVDELNEQGEKKRELNKKLKQLLAEKLKSIEDQNFEKTKLISFEITATREILQSMQDIVTESNEEEQEEKNNDPEIVIKCLNIICALLTTSEITSITPVLKSLKDELFSEIMVCNDPTIQGKYFRCYGQICYLNKTMAEENIQFFCLPLSIYYKEKSGDIEVITAATDVIGDFLLLYGTQILPVYEEEDPNKSLDFELLYGKDKITLTEVVNIFSLMLDDSNIQIRQSSCEVLVKLMFTRRIESAELFSRLFLKWLSPATVEDVRFRQIIGVFIEMFCQLPDVELQLEKSIIPTLRTISLSPVTSPLANISKELIKSIITIINLRHDQDYTIHENLALEICMEMQKDHTSPCIPLFAKALLYLELYRGDKVYIDELLNISEDILIELKDRNAVNNMKKFIYSLKHE